MEGMILAVERAILRMAGRLRRKHSGLPAREGVGLGWWVLAVGDPLDADSFEDREASRERLRERVEAAGIRLPEHTWVWDERGRAQLVIATLPDKDRADKVADRLRDKGLSIRVAREFI